MKKAYLFFGFAIPTEQMQAVFAEDQLPQVQTHKFNWNLIKGLEYWDRFALTYISSRPVGDYPYYPHRFIRRQVWMEEVHGRSIKILELPFINVSVFKVISRFLWALTHGLREFHSKVDKAGVIVYSVHVPFMLAGLILARIYNIACIGVWTDPPAVRTQREGAIKAKLRNLEYILSKHLMRRFSKVVVVAERLAIDFAPGKQYMVMEGITDVNEVSVHSGGCSNSHHGLVKFVYTGSLDARYGIRSLVEGFRLLQNVNCILEIYGKGELEAELKKLSGSFDNVTYKGYIPNERILLVQRNADFLVNPRPNTDGFVKYSFPSKILEYMLSGTPIITTILSGMPEVYRHLVVPLDSCSPVHIAQVLDQAVRMSSDERRELAKKAFDFVQSINYINQGRRVCDFVADDQFFCD